MKPPFRLSGPRVKPRSGAPARELVALLHGVGADGADLIELAGPWARLLPHAQFVAPNGPEPYDMAPLGYQWFSLKNRDPAALLDGVKRVHPLIDAFLDAELACLGLSDERLALVGFSQGAMVALHVAPRRPRASAALLGFSGALIGPELLDGEVRSRPPVMLIHGEADPIVPVEALPAAVDALGRAGMRVVWHISRGVGHGIDATGLEMGGRFLANAFAGEA